MKLVVNIKLCPTAEQHELLLTTLETCNAACNYLSQTGWATKILRQYDLHKLAYHDVRTQFKLSAQVAVRCIAKVADTYKINKTCRHEFRNHSSQPYDDRIFRFCGNDIISIWTMTGRQKIATELGDYQRKMLPFRKGEVELMFVKGKWYIACVCDIDEPEIIKTTDVLGVDFGIVNLATDSTGNNYSGKSIKKNVQIFNNRRKNLQKKGTNSAKRKLKKISGKQAKFQKDRNHCIAKSIVQTAQRYSSTIALEDLKNFRKNIKAIRRQRRYLHNWQFAQLRTYIEYKAKLGGIPVIAVDPAYTSQTCPACGHVAKANRKTRDEFVCQSCGLAGHADYIAALNIRSAGLKAKAAVNPANGDVVYCTSHVTSITSPVL